MKFKKNKKLSNIKWCTWAVTSKKGAHGLLPQKKVHMGFQLKKNVPAKNCLSTVE